VPGLRADDFIVYDDNQPQAISHFNAERVPVSLGLALDTSGSMTYEKMSSARGAIERFMDTMLSISGDEMFLFRFANVTQLVQPWTSDRRPMTRALAGLEGTGGTALYDAVADAVPVAQSGRNPKKALLLISDGNDTGSRTSPTDLRQIIRESEVLVYAIGIDGTSRDTFGGLGLPPIQLPFPFPGRRGGRRSPSGGGGGQTGVWSGGGNERVNAAALRGITDDTGGRTEIVRDAGDLAGATARIADELTRQYYIGYAATGTKDGRWHSIRVDVRNRNLIVRARKGYVAS
jgi:VWFA-related protein